MHSWMEYDYQYEYPDEEFSGEEYYQPVEPVVTESPVLQCLYSPWEEWSNCSALCGSGVTVRTRSVVRKVSIDSKFLQ